MHGKNLGFYVEVTVFALCNFHKQSRFNEGHSRTDHRTTQLGFSNGTINTSRPPTSISVDVATHAGNEWEGGHEKDEKMEYVYMH